MCYLDLIPISRNNSTMPENRRVEVIVRPLISGTSLVKRATQKAMDAVAHIAGTSATHWAIVVCFLSDSAFLLT